MFPNDDLRTSAVRLTSISYQYGGHANGRQRFICSCFHLQSDAATRTIFVRSMFSLAMNEEGKVCL